MGRRKGTKALKCCDCGTIVGWDVPTGKYVWGIPVVEQRFKPNAHVITRRGGTYYICDECLKPDDSIVECYEGRGKKQGSNSKKGGI